jgi:hypothetical protein
MVWARSSGSTILAVTDVCAGTTLASGNSVTTPAWRAEIVGGDTFPVVFGTQGETVAAPTMFSPSNIADLQVWLAPESTVTVSGGRVKSWADKSGSGNDAVQNLNSASPTHLSAVGGYNAVQFVGGRLTALRIASTAAACAISSSAMATWTGALVYQASALGASDMLVYSGISAGVTNFRGVRHLTGAYSFTETFNSINSAQTVGSAKVTPTVLRWVFNSVISAWENGVSIVTSAKVSAGDNIVGSNIGICIGSQANGGNAFSGHMWELLISSTAMSSAQGRQLDVLLGAKYGISIT